MATVETILAELEYIANHPAQMVEDWKKETGGKAVGCLPIHYPEEVIHAMGMLPVGLWGGQTTITQAAEYLQAFCCSIMKAVMEFAIKGVYKNLDAIVAPETCDTLRCIPLMLRIALPELPVIGLVLPDNRKIEAGIRYTADEYRHVAEQLAAINNGKPISEDSLHHSIEVYNRHHASMMEFFSIAADHCDIITPYYRHMVVKSSFFVPKEKHAELVQALNAALKELPVNRGTRRVVVTGIMPEPYELLKLFEEFGYSIVADDLAQGSRQFRTPTPEGHDPFIRLGQRFANFEGCSCVYDPEKLRGKMIADMAREYQADGVIVLMMKFCDPEEYDYPFMKQDLEAAGIPHLYLEIEQQMETLEQVRTRLQAFAEILDQRP